MPKCIIVDTFPAFVEFWNDVLHQSTELQFEHWVTKYMNSWPKLLAKQHADYANQGIDWREVARARIFPYLAYRLALMKAASITPLGCVEPAYQQARRALTLDFDVSFVIYVGLGCGAGRGTAFAGMPACLFGLENIAEEGYVDQESLSGLVAHELGHLLHTEWRSRCAAEVGEVPYWLLYREGFAMRCEHATMNTVVKSGKDDQWLAWCRQN